MGAPDVGPYGVELASVNGDVCCGVWLLLLGVENCPGRSVVLP